MTGRADRRLERCSRAVAGLLLAVLWVGATSAHAARFRGPQAASRIQIVIACGTGPSSRTASGLLILPQWKVDPNVRARARSMSLGPPSPLTTDSSSSLQPQGKPQSEAQPPHRLRVTAGRFGRSHGIWIDEVLRGRSGTLTVVGTYYIQDVQALAGVLSDAISAWSPVPPDPPVRWITPRSFEVIGVANRLVLEQRSDSLFHVSWSTTDRWPSTRTTPTASSSRR